MVSIQNILICVFLFVGARGFADPTGYPRRVINYHQVDLLPLIIWWEKEKPQGVRPLTSWKHVHGFLERETPYGWMVRGTIEGQTGLQFFLVRNPPAKEISRYRELNQLLPKLQQERASALVVAQLPAYKGWDWDINGATTRVPTEDFDRIEQAKSNLQDLDQRIHGARAEMEGMLDTRGYFKVDAFALQLNQVYERSPIFDFGFPFY